MTCQLFIQWTCDAPTCWTCWTSNMLSHSHVFGCIIERTDVNCLIDLHEKLVGVEIPVLIFARLEYNLGFPSRCENVRQWMMG